MTGIERQVGAAGLEHGEDPGQEIERALAEQRHHPVGAHAGGDEAASQAARAAVELGVGQRARIGDDGHGIRGTRHLGLELTRIGLVERQVGIRGIPLGQHALALVGGQQGQRGQPAVRVLHDAPHQGLEVPENPLRRGGVEPLAPVDQPEMQPLRPVEGVEGQALGGRGEIEGRPQGKPHAAAVRLEARGEVQQVEEHLEERVAIGMPPGTQLLDQPLERHVLMRVGAERHLAHPRQQLAERRIAREIRPQHQRIDEDAEQLVGPRLVAAGDRRSHDQVLLPGVPEQQALERGQGGHEHRDALALAQPPEGAGHVGREHARAHRGLEGRRGRMRSVGRQIEQLGSAGQLTSPVGKLWGERAVREPRPLPLGEVRVLDRQRGQVKRPRLGQRRVRLGELTHEDGDRPAVEDGVMRRHREQVGLGREPQQAGANERPLRQVEGATRLLRGLAAHRLLALARRQPRQVQNGHRRRRGLDDLDDVAVEHLQRRAQHRVALDQQGQRPLEPLGRQRTGQLQDQRDVVGGTARRDLIEEPLHGRGRPREREGHPREAGAALSVGAADTPLVLPRHPCGRSSAGRQPAGPRPHCATAQHARQQAQT